MRTTTPRPVMTPPVRMPATATCLLCNSTPCTRPAHGVAHSVGQRCLERYPPGGIAAPLPGSLGHSLGVSLGDSLGSLGDSVGSLGDSLGSLGDSLGSLGLSLGDWLGSLGDSVGLPVGLGSDGT